MKFLGNLIWLLFGGILGAIVWSLIGLILCITIIGAPFGLQCLKIGGFVLWPFGRDVDLGQFGAFGLLGNIIWIIICGWELCIAHLITALIFSITIVLIPFGLQHFKLAKLSLIPFGARIYNK